MNSGTDMVFPFPVDPPRMIVTGLPAPEGLRYEGNLHSHGPSPTPA